VFEMAGVLAGVYAVGVAAGLLFTDAPLASRLALALLWPVGPLAFVATLGVLVGAALVAFPWLGAALLLVALAYSVLSV
jgi:hypothetical protein